MAERYHSQFGDKGTSDVILRLTYANGEEYDGNPLFVHSHVLKKSDFFGAMLSERWSSEVRPIELRAGIRDNVDQYLKCIELMYLSGVERLRCFSNVKEAIDILEIASEFLWKECVEACMQYLEAVRWNREENLQIQALISALQLKPTPDLAAKLGIPEPVEDSEVAGKLSNSERVHDSETGKNLGTLISLISTEATVRDITPKLLLADFEVDAPPALAEAIASALCCGLQRNLDVIKSELNNTSSFDYNFHHSANCNIETVLHKIGRSGSAVLWILQHLHRLQMLEPAVKLFAEGQHDLILALRRHRTENNPFTDTLFKILTTLSHALGSGEVISPRAVRLCFITTWCPPIEELYYYGNPKYASDSTRKILHEKLVEELIAAAGTLPLVDRAQVVNIWIEACLKLSAPVDSDLSKAIAVCCNQVRLDSESSLLHKQLRQAFLLKLDEPKAEKLETDSVDSAMQKP